MLREAEIGTGRKGPRFPQRLENTAEVFYCDNPASETLTKDSIGVRPGRQSEESRIQFIENVVFHGDVKLH
jgi:hypothetical protein